MNKLTVAVLTSTLLASALLTSGCASIVDGTKQRITIETTPAQGAQCYISNNKGQWYLCSTPGCVMVHRSYGDLTILARKPGYRDKQICVQSSTKGMAYGNILFGGAIGVGVDCGDGAAYDYPDHVIIPMQPKAKH